MSTGIETLRESERIALELRGLFTRYGYEEYRMSRFEEYELYVRNKDFLASDRMIVFTDLNGSLMALKPDVTISIIRNTVAEPGTVKKVYYHENVYRANVKANAFREIMQTGLECVGTIDRFRLCETVLLALKSLAVMGREYLLDISHLGLVSGALTASGVPGELYPEVLGCIRDKNLSELRKLCAARNLEERLLSELITSYGDMAQVLGRFESLCENDAMRDALDDLRGIQSVLESSGFAQRARLDFSVVNDMRYYNGLVFQGFLSGIPVGVLSGGQYDKLMRKMGKMGGAVGFAVYLNELESLNEPQNSPDGDVLLLYREGEDPATLSRLVEKLTTQGRTVCAQRVIPGSRRYQTILRPEDRGAEDG